MWVISLLYILTKITWASDKCVMGPVQSLSHAQLFVTPWTAAHQASMSITNTQSLFKLMSIELVMPPKHLILCRHLLLPAYGSSIFPSIRVFSNESVLCIKWPKYWSFSFSISPSNEYSGNWFPLGSTGWISTYRWHHPYGRKQRKTKELLDENEKGEWKSWFKTQHLEN